MNDVETRSLRRAAVLLLVVSGLRWGWQARPRVDPPPAREAGVQLLAGSRARAEEEERRSRPLAPGERVDPNRATAVELDRLPGIGAATAREVVAFRDSAGGFRGPQELARVRGIGEATVARLRPLLDFSVAMPAALSRRGLEGTRARVAVNRADEATLETLPGVGPALARRIVEARRLRLFGQAEDLLAVPGIGPATLERIRPWITLDP